MFTRESEFLAKFESERKRKAQRSEEIQINPIIKIKVLYGMPGESDTVYIRSKENVSIEFQDMGQGVKAELDNLIQGLQKAKTLVKKDK